jgi:hypothetical protein
LRRQFHYFPLFALVLITGLLLAVAVAASTMTLGSPQAAPLQSTVGAAVEAAFTQTAQAADTDPATVAFQQTVGAALNATLTATYQPSPTLAAEPNTLNAANAAAIQTALVFDQGTAITAIDIKADQVASASMDGVVYLWDAQTGEIQQALRHDQPIADLRFNPAQPEIITLDINGALFRWRTDTGQQLAVGQQADTTGQPTITGFAENGQRFTVYTADGTLTLWGYPDVGPLSSVEGLLAAHVDINNDIAAYVYAEAPTELQLARGANTETLTIPDADQLNPISFDAQGERLILATATGYVVIDTTTGDMLFSLPQPTDAPPRFSPDGSMIATLADDGALLLYDATNGDLLAQQAGHDSSGRGLSFRADGEQLITRGDGANVRVWQANPPAEPLRIAAAAVALSATPTPMPAGPTPLPEGFPPITQTEVQVAEQVFEGGRMFWVQPVNQLWVMIIDEEGRGDWIVFEDTFSEDEDPITDPNLTPPSDDLLQPERGFGKLWRENQDVRDALGWGITPEFGYVSQYRYVPGGEITDGEYVPGPGFHVLFSLAGEAFRFNEVDGTWQLGDS